MPSKFDKPASVSWIVTGLGGKPMPGNTRYFPTLRAAVLYVCRLPHGAHTSAIVRSGRKRYDITDCEQLEGELRRR